MKTGFLAVALLVAVPVSLRAQAGDPLPLDKAIELALAHNRQIASENLQVDRTADSLTISRAKRLPVVDLNFLTGQLLTELQFTFPAAAFGTFPGIGPVPATETAITTPRRPSGLLYATVAEPLTQWPRINLGIRASELDQQAERERLRRTRQTVVSQVKQAYYGILQTQSALDATTESIALYRELNRVTHERMLQQVVLKSDGLEVELHLAQAEQTRLSQQHSLESLQEQLNQAMGRDISTPFTVIPVPDSPSAAMDVAAATRQAQDRNPDIREARLRVEQADVDRRAKKSERIPDISFTFTYLSPLNVNYVPSSIAMLGLQLQWQPLDWGKRGRELATKERALEQAKLALQDAENKVALTVHAQIRQLEDLRAQVRVASLSQDVARERLRVKTDQVKLSATLPADVLQVQAQLADASSKYQQTLLEFWTARAELDQTLGEDVQP